MIIIFVLVSFDVNIPPFLREGCAHDLLSHFFGVLMGLYSVLCIKTNFDVHIKYNRYLLGPRWLEARS